MSLFVYSNISFSQLSLKGYIYNSDSIPLESCSVLLLSKHSKNIISYTFSDSTGHFNLLITNNINSFDSILISINSFGYREITIPFNQINSLNILYTYLEHSQNQIDEVLISEKSYEIKNKDTLIYNLNNYRDSFETSIGQLLNKLPGVSVSQEGDVFVYGVGITNITIDGDDISGSRYQVLTNSLNPNIIQTAEIILNYDENPILSEIFDSKSISINLKTNDNYKNNFSASFAGAVGTRKTYESSIDGIGLYNKFKFLSNIKFNNIGIGIPGLTQYDLGSLITKSGLKDPPLINKADYTGTSQDLTKMNNYLGSQNLFLYKVNESTKITLNYFYDHEKYEKQNYLNYLLKIGGKLRNDNLAQLSNLNQNALALYLNSRLSKNIQLKINLGTSRNNFENNQITNNYNFKSNNRYYLNSMYSDLIIKLANKAAAQTTIQVINNNQNNISQYYFTSQFLYPYNTTSNELSQTLRLPFRRINFTETIYKKINKTNLLFGIGLQNSTLSPNLHVSNDDLNINSSNKQNYQDIYAVLNIDSKVNRLFELNTKLQNGFLSTYIPPIVNTAKTVNYFNIINSLSYNINTKSNIKLSIGKSTNFSNNYFLFDNFRLINRYNFLKNELPIAITTSLLGSLRYNFSSTIPLVKSYLDINYSKNNSPYLITSTFRSNSELFEQEYIKEINSSQIVGINFGFEWLIKKFYTNIKFKPYYYNNQLIGKYNGIKSDIKNNNIGFALNIGTGFNLPINASFGYEPLLSTSNIISENSNISTKSNQNLYFSDLRLNLKRLSLKWNNSFYSSSSIDNFKKVNEISNLQIKFNLPKSNIKLEAKMFNVFNNKDIRTLVNTQFYQIDDIAAQRGRFIILGTSINLTEIMRK